jgi:ribosomal protein L12E/L44/L45/RPP1/RPP2
MSDEVSNKLAEAAVGPKRVRTDAGEVEAHDLDQIIEADKYLAAKAAASSANKHRGLRFNRIIPPGTI